LEVRTQKLPYAPFLILFYFGSSTSGSGGMFDVDA
jgi:hypothetical protein